MMRRRALLAGWLLVLAISAALPLSALFRGIVHIGPGSLVLETTPTKPVIALGSDVYLHRGTRSIVLSVGGNIYVDAMATDDLVALDGKVYLKPGSRINADVVDIVGGIYRARNVHVSGRLGGALHAWNGHAAVHTTAKTIVATNFRLGLAAGLALLLVGTCLTIVFPWQVVLIAATLRKAPVKSAAAGVMNLLIFVFLVVPLGLSLVGLPFALLLTGAASLAWLFGLTACAVLVGRLVSRRTVSLLWATAGGLLVIALAMAIPVVGPLAVSILGLAGAGALAVALLQRARPSAPIP